MKKARIYKITKNCLRYPLHKNINRELQLKLKERINKEKVSSFGSIGRIVLEENIFEENRYLPYLIGTFTLKDLMASVLGNIDLYYTIVKGYLAEEKIKMKTPAWRRLLGYVREPKHEKYQSMGKRMLEEIIKNSKLDKLKEWAKNRYESGFY
jgi:hypothetical protein